MRRRLLMLLAGVACVSGACVSSSFDRHFDARRWEDAARVFDADSSLHESHRALYRAAIVYATPATPAYDPLRARELLERLLEMEPRAPRAVEATAMLALLYEVQRHQNELTVRERAATRRIGELAREVAMLHDHIAWIEEQQAASSEEAAQLRALANNLTATLRERESRVQALQQELDRLKEIDLNPAVRPPGSGAGAGAGGAGAGGGTSGTGPPAVGLPLRGGAPRRGTQ